MPGKETPLCRKWAAAFSVRFLGFTSYDLRRGCSSFRSPEGERTQAGGGAAELRPVTATFLVETGAHREKSEMPAHQYLASLFRLRAHALRRDRVLPHHPVGFGLFFALYPRVWGFESSLSTPTQVVRVAHSTPWLLYAASPCGEALKFRSLRSPACRPRLQGVGNKPLPSYTLLAGASPPNLNFVDCSL